jgi:hypothetical protein
MGCVQQRNGERVGLAQRRLRAVAMSNRGAQSAAQRWVQRGHLEPQRQIGTGRRAVELDDGVGQQEGRLATIYPQTDLL